MLELYKVEECYILSVGLKIWIAYIWNVFVLLIFFSKMMVLI